MILEFHDNSKELEVESWKYASDGRKENQFGAINITAIEENKFGARYEEQYKMDYVISEDELRSLSSDSETESAKPSLVYREGDVKKPRFQWQVHMIFSSHKEFKWTVECYASMNKKAVKFVKNETGKEKAGLPPPLPPKYKAQPGRPKKLRKRDKRDKETSNSTTIQQQFYGNQNFPLCNMVLNMK
nr:Zinc knuckle family protein [Ipomoea batatas]